MENTLQRRLRSRGFQARVVAFRRLEDLQASIEAKHRTGLLNDELYRRYLARLAAQPPEDLPEPGSLIIVAFEDPPVRFIFGLEGRRIPLVVPPTYLHWEEKDGRAKDILAELAGEEGFRVAPIAVPKKLLAACAGLSLYGMNNLSYVDGMGSFHRLAAFCSDMPWEADEWREPRQLDRCDGCGRCAQSCPTGAIDPERFLLRAERCITYLNEKPGGVPFPDWVDGSWHNALVGCMRCQTVCPENLCVLGRCEEGGEYSEAETRLLLEGASRDDLPPHLVEKLERSDLIGLLDLIPRNLRAFLVSRT